MTDEYFFMAEALALAKEAALDLEVPVGCVIASGDRIVGRGRNRREKRKNALWHAEIEAIDSACRTLGGWRLTGCRLYVTLEPCPMCAGAIINARIDEIYYGAADPNTGACGSVLNLFEENFNHKPKIYGGILEKECAELLSGFFKTARR